MKSLTIMIVEDEEDIADLFSDYLQMKGWKKVVRVSSGKEALAQIPSKKPDMIFLDIQLSDNISGIDVLKKTRDVLPKTKIVMMSAYQDEYESKTKALGASGFLRKPFRADALDAILNQLLP